MKTAANRELKALVFVYGRLLPMWTFPLLPLVVAAIFQTLAWLSGPVFFQNLTLMPRIFALWMFAIGEYLFMSPTMNAGVEVLGMSEATLVVMYQVATLVVFMVLDLFLFRNEFKVKYLVAFLLLAAAVYVTYMF